MTEVLWKSAAAGALVVLLAGCANGADDAAKTTATSLATIPDSAYPGGKRPTAPPTTTAAPTAPGATTPAGPPVMPEVAKTNTKAGAEAFALWYLESVNYTLQHPDVGMPKVAGPSCQTCARFKELVADLTLDSRHYDSPPYTLSRASRSAQVSTDWLVDIPTQQNAARVVDTTGKVTETLPTRTGSYQPQLRWVDGSWQVQAVRKQVNG